MPILAAKRLRHLIVRHSLPGITEDQPILPRTRQVPRQLRINGPRTLSLVLPLVDVTGMDKKHIERDIYLGDLNGAC
jgi:hypothetical protein